MTVTWGWIIWLCSWFNKSVILPTINSLLLILQNLILHLGHAHHVMLNTNEHVISFIFERTNIVNKQKNLTLVATRKTVGGQLKQFINGMIRSVIVRVWVRGPPGVLELETPLSLPYHSSRGRGVRSSSRQLSWLMSSSMISSPADCHRREHQSGVAKKETK